MVDWFSNDKLFLRELRDGHAWQMLPTVFFALHGLEVVVPSLAVRRDVSERRAWRSSVDIRVGGWDIEVKSRRERFTSPADYPYPTAYVDTVSGYESKPRPPLAYVLVSRPTGGMLALSVARTRELWTVRESRDRTRGITDAFYEVPRRCLVSLDALVGALKSQ
jgi:hypothetical protein